MFFVADVPKPPRKACLSPASRIARCELGAGSGELPSAPAASFSWVAEEFLFDRSDPRS